MRNYLPSKANAAFILTMSLVLVATSANAALPTEASAALTAAGTAVADSASAAWVPIGAAMAASIVIKLVKRFFNKI